MNWKNRLDKELQNARTARNLGNEGQARVCARRAAGVIVKEFYSRQEWKVSSVSAYDLLKSLQDFPALSMDAGHSVELLLLRVNADFDLPEGVDLIAEVEKLTKTLLPDEEV